MDAEPVPVSILTGFLGSGKTTLLNRLLADPALADTAVIINEFGEVGLDHLLVERADGDVFEMASGCLCCTIRGDLVDTLERLIERRDRGEVRRFERVMIETTGLADPAPVLHTVMNHPYLVTRYRLAGVITVVDAVNGLATLDAHAEAVKQVAVADRLVLSKADLLVGIEGEDHLHATVARLRRLAPGARMLDVHTGEASAANLLDTGSYDPATRSPDVRRWLAAEAYEAGEGTGRRRGGRHRHGDHGHGHDHAHDVNRHDDHIRSFCITSAAALSPMAFQLFLELLRSHHGPNLLRVKGIVRLSDDEDRPVVIHGVQHVFHPPFRMARWPDDDRRSRIVFIVKDIRREELAALFDAFASPLEGGAEARRDDTLSLRRGDG